jgi:hypothetical protein
MSSGNTAFKKAETKASSNVLLFQQKQSPASPVHVAPEIKPVADPLVPTIFHETWWLDAVTGGNYNYVEVRDKNNVVGRLPYFMRSKWGMKYSTMPAMTHFLGPAVIEGDGAAPTRFLRREQITRDLLRQLPKASLYRYKCHRDITDTIPFMQEKFMTSVQFTHEIAPATPDTLFKNMRSEKRKKIRQAEGLLTLADITDPHAFWAFYENNLRKRNVSSYYDKELCLKLLEGSLSRECGRIFGAYDKNKDLVAAVYCIWDGTSYLYYMSTRSANAHNGAISLLAWEAMKDASARGLIFDMDGVNNANSVLFFTEFGGVVSPRYIVTKQSAIGGAVWSARELLRENRYFY